MTAKRKTALLNESLRETGISSPQELLSRYASNEDGSITFEELKQAVRNADNLT